MKVTLNEIAKMAGVSRGIVDRVYHNRGYVKAEKRALVQSLLEQHDYTPNRMARALSVSQKRKSIAVVLNSIGNEFFDEVIRGIDEAVKEYSDYGLFVEMICLKGYSAEQQLDAMDRVAGGSFDALVLTPVNDARIARKIDSLMDRGIAVITLNTDIDDSKRLCYIGCDYYMSGQMAGGFLSLVNAGNEAKIGIVQGSRHAKGHILRYNGFIEVLSKSGHRIVAQSECGDDEAQACRQTLEMLGSGDVDYIYVVAGGLQGVEKAILDSGKDVKVVSNDLTRAAREGLEKGIILASIFQQPYRQGYLSIKTIFEYIYQDIKIDQNRNDIRLSYVTKYNLW